MEKTLLIGLPPTTCLHITLYDPKQPAPFISGRWQRGTNLDLTFSTQIYGITPGRYILERFATSQHRPSLITTPLMISFTSSAPIPRWNFRKADRELFTEELEKAAEDLPTPCKENLNIAYNLYSFNKDSSKEMHPSWFSKVIHSNMG